MCCISIEKENKFLSWRRTKSKFEKEAEDAAAAVAAVAAENLTENLHSPVALEGTLRIRSVCSRWAHSVRWIMANTLPNKSSNASSHLAAAFARFQLLRIPLLLYGFPFHRLSSHPVCAQLYLAVAFATAIRMHSQAFTVFTCTHMPAARGKGYGTTIVVATVFCLLIAPLCIN